MSVFDVHCMKTCRDALVSSLSTRQIPTLVHRMKCSICSMMGAMILPDVSSEVVLKSKRVSRGHSSSKFSSRYESRRHGVIDGEITKKYGGDRYHSRNRSPDRSSKESHRLTRHITDAKPVPEASTKAQDPTPQDSAEPEDKLIISKPPRKRYNELNPLMTKVVEEELRDIMIKIWQTLPDETSEEGETKVVDKLRGEAGDDLRNTIGLNITKRLLNVHNEILVKLVIFSTVTPDEFFDFANKYRISDFKHVQRWTYAGRMASWTDFDRLYETKNLRCGKSRVIVSPVYSFLKCPPSLKTIFDGNQNYSQAKIIELETARRTKKPEAKVIVTADKVLAEEAKKELAKKEKILLTKENSTDAKESKPVSKISEPSKTVSASKITDNTTNQPSSNIGKKEITTPKQNKTEEQSKIDVKTTTNDEKQAKAESQNKVEPAKIANKPASAAKQNTALPKGEPEKTVANKPTLTSVAKQNILSQTNVPKGETDKTSVTKQNTVPLQKIETERIIVNKPATSIAAKQDTISSLKSGTKAETVSNKPAISTSKKDIVTTKLDNNETSNESTATIKNTASPQPNSTKVETTKAANKPTTANNTNKNTASLKPEVKAVPTTTKKEIISPKTNEKKPVLSAKEPTKQVKDPVKVTNKPVPANSAKPFKTNDTKKPEPKSVKVETQAKVQPKVAANKPNDTPKNAVKSKPENKKVDTTASRPINPIPSNTNADNVENDFDELDDHDILALLSSGIVLDECNSSSEDGL